MHPDSLEREESDETFSVLGVIIEYQYENEAQAVSARGDDRKHCPRFIRNILDRQFISEVFEVSPIWEEIFNIVQDSERHSAARLPIGRILDRYVRTCRRICDHSR
jgi:hypothetical protein